jgi:signal transduction histidine kinase
MNWNSVMVRIWLPFLSAALMLLYFLAVRIPALQQETLSRFHTDKLRTAAATVEGVLEHALKQEDFTMIDPVLSAVPDMELVDRIGILLEDQDTLFINYLPGFGADDYQGGSDRKLMSLLREDVTTHEMAKAVGWSGALPDSIGAFFQGDQLAGVTVEEFYALMDTDLVVRIDLDYGGGDAWFGTTALVVGNTSSFNAELRNLREPFILIQTLLALGAIALFYYLAFHISRPILGVAAVAEEMRQGNFDVEIEEISTLNEMGMLTQALRELRDELSRKRIENDELTNDMERKIVERTEQLEEAMRAKDEFLSTMSHEIRTPLHSLIAIGDMLRREEDHGDRQDLMRSLSTSSKQLLALINDILDFSKISAGKLELHVEPVPLRAFFEELAEPFELSAKPGVEFVKAWPDKLEDHVVEMDSMRLSQVLHNLLSNAFKFTESGEVILSIRCKELEKERQPHVGLEVQVVDTGVGIAEENVEAILKAFTQENSSISRKFGGTGLGLSIVNRLLHMMGSDLEVQSTAGQGSMFGFYLELPLTQEQAVIEQAPDAEGGDLSNLRLLYVEDMEPNRFVMKAMVRPWKVQLSQADSGRQALEILANQSFDLVLMDIQMPEMDGVETLQQVRARNAGWNTPVVAFTAHAQDSDVARYKSHGFADVLTKPAGPDVLKAFLHQYVVNK